MTFDELLYNDSVLDALEAMRFNECTPIQQQAIPYVEEGRDLIAIAQTGTGKTAAYLLPIIDILADGGYPADAVNCVVLAPTRELAQQIDQQMQGFSYFMPVSSIAIYGGTDGLTFNQQKEGLKKGADVVIATPGRLLDHIGMGYVDLSKVSFLVLDEADRMLDMGFYPDIMQIVSKLPVERQTLLFSATMPEKIRDLSQRILRDPATVQIALSKPAEKIEQGVYVCYENQKENLLRHIITEEPEETKRILVFCSSKLKVKQLARALRASKIPAAEMHSDLDQRMREDVILNFKSGKTRVLVATDIVARGIDISDIAMVVNFDVPREGEEYVHRVGRTARAEASGRAITFVSEKERERFRLIERLIDIKVPRLEVPEWLGKTPKKEGNADRRRDNSHGNSRGNGRKKDRTTNRGNNASTPKAKKPETAANEATMPTKAMPNKKGAAPNPNVAATATPNGAQASTPNGATAVNVSNGTQAEAAPKANKKRRFFHHRKKKPQTPKE